MSTTSYPGADVRYPTRSMALNMLLAAPALTAMMLAEARAVARLHRGHGFGLIVSDNRFGCRVPGVRSLIITHQVHLPLKPAPSRVVADVINHGLLRRFDGVLVPDYAEPPRLAGPMSAPLSGVPVRYVGPVSRLGPGSGRPSVAEARAGAMPDGPPGAASVVCLLSGPEPTRTSFEGALISNLPAALDAALGGGEYGVTLVRGTRAARSAAVATTESLHAARWTIEDLLTGEGVGRVLAKADLILCRPGYTTVMDLAALGRAAVYVPTPGQPEQEWFGQSLDAQGRGVCVAQEAIDRPGVLAEAVRRLEALSAAGVRLSPKPVGDALDAWAAGEISRLAARTVNIV